jgi:hypothetical protein
MPTRGHGRPTALPSTNERLLRCNLRWVDGIRGPHKVEHAMVFGPSGGSGRPDLNRRHLAPKTRGSRRYRAHRERGDPLDITALRADPILAQDAKLPGHLASPRRPSSTRAHRTSLRGYTNLGCRASGSILIELLDEVPMLLGHPSIILAIGPLGPRRPDVRPLENTCLCGIARIATLVSDTDGTHETGGFALSSKIFGLAATSLREIIDLGYA